MYTYRCEIVRVVDGDTIDVNIDLGFNMWIHNERIRLNGIDTPETRTKDLEEKKFGLLAKTIVTELMPLGSIHTLITEKDDKGKFGRYLGDFEIDTYRGSLVEWMLKNNYGVPYDLPKNQRVLAHIANRELIYERNEFKRRILLGE